LFAVPGERLAEVEEFMPSDGSCELDGIVFATNVGDVQYDSNDRVVRVVFPKRSPRLNVANSIVYGRISQTFDHYAAVELYPYSTRRYRLLPSSKHATLHISKIRKGFVKSVRGELGVGDWIRAKIISIQKKRFIQLSTEDAQYGIIKAYCSLCRQPLLRRGAALYCPRCKRSFRRKISGDYGQPRLPR